MESVTAIEEIDRVLQVDSRDNTLVQLLGDKVQTLADILRSIDCDAAARQRVSADVLNGIERDYCYLKTKLYELDTWQVGANRTIESRRSKLEAQLDKLNQETREERTREWQDIAMLRKEQRIWLKQYCDLLQRVELVTSRPRIGLTPSGERALPAAKNRRRPA